MFPTFSLFVFYLYFLFLFVFLFSFLHYHTCTFLVSSALARRHLWKSAKNFEKYFIYHKVRRHTSKATIKYKFCDGRHERKENVNQKCVNKSIYNREESETKKTTTNPIQEKTERGVVGTNGIWTREENKKSLKRDVLGRRCALSKPTRGW